MGYSLWGCKESNTAKQLTHTHTHTHTHTEKGFMGCSAGKEFACNVGDLGLIPGWEYSLKEGMQPTPVFLPGESLWIEQPGKLQSRGSQRVGHNWVTSTAHTKKNHTEGPGPSLLFTGTPVFYKVMINLSYKRYLNHIIIIMLFHKWAPYSTVGVSPTCLNLLLWTEMLGDANNIMGLMKEHVS